MDERDILKIIGNAYTEESKAVSDLNDQFIEERRKALKEAGKTEKQIGEQIDKDRRKLQEDYNKKHRKELLEEQIKNQKLVIEASATLEQKKSEEEKLRKLKNEEERIKLWEKASKALENSLSSVFGKVDNSVDKYSNLLSDIQTRLIGSGKTYESVSDMISKTFSGSPFFKMTDALNNVQRFVQQGIAYNVELRASLQTVSEKIVKTFDALDSTLLRLTRIQGDTTQARMGIERSLTEFLNSQFKDTSYFASNINASVTAALVDAEARLGQTMGTEFEYEAQKWLGSLYSVGASENLINALAQGLGALGSGNISALTSNQTLLNLLAKSSETSGGSSLGSMITSGVQASDISNLMTGLYNLVNEVNQTGNVVALNEYARVFGLTISDLKSILNLTSNDIKNLTNTTLTYNEALKVVTDELSSSVLRTRTAGGELISNIYQNIIDTVGTSIASSAGKTIAWKTAQVAASFLEGQELNIGGIFGGMSLDLGKTTKAIALLSAFGSNLGTLVSGLSNLSGVNLENLENLQTVERGQLIGMREGRQESYTRFVGDVSTSSIYKTSTIAAEEQASKVTDSSLDEQTKATKNMQNRIQSIDDNVTMIVRLLDIEGIVIRGRVGETSSNYMNSLAGVGGVFNG